MPRAPLDLSKKVGTSRARLPDVFSFAPEAKIKVKLTDRVPNFLPSFLLSVACFIYNQRRSHDKSRSLNTRLLLSNAPAELTLPRPFMGSIDCQTIFSHKGRNLSISLSRGRVEIVDIPDRLLGLGSTIDRPAPPDA